LQPSLQAGSVLEHNRNNRHFAFTETHPHVVATPFRGVRHLAQIEIRRGD
jgi:hypothetical protein